MGRQKNPKAQAASDAIGFALHQRLKALAAERGENKTTLAKKSGIDRTMVSRILTGKRWATLDQAVLLAEALGVDPGELLGAAMNAARTQSTASDGLTTLGPGERRPPGLEKWLWKRLGIDRRELWGLEHHRARGIAPSFMETDEFWERELEWVRGLAAQNAGDGGGAGGGQALEAKRAAPRKSSH